MAEEVFTKEAAEEGNQNVNSSGSSIFLLKEIFLVVGFLCCSDIVCNPFASFSV